MTAPATGSYVLERGFPTRESSQRARDDADYDRALVSYHFWYPTVSAEGFFNGYREVGIEDNAALGLFAAGPRLVAFTANSDTPYSAGALDLKQGPIVVEVPPGPYIAVVNDHHQGWIMDIGLPGPDAGKGGKHLVLPPDYTGSVPDGHHVGRSSTYKALVAIRCLPLDGDLAKALNGIRSIKVYPLNEPSKSLRFVDLSDKEVDITSLRWEDNFTFWEKLHRVIAMEPVQKEFRPMYGLLRDLGIAKDKPFAPDARMKGILTAAARVARDQILVSAFDSARPDRVAWKDRHWEWVSLVADNGNFETSSGIDLEARDRWFAQAVAGSPAMFRRQVGFGSLYWLSVRDKDGNWLDGGKSYKLTVPQPVPGKLFWSVTIYDPETRSQVRTDQDKAALRSLFELKSQMAGKTVDLFFGPKAPVGKEGVWIKTIPGKGWFAYFRIYGPEAPAFDESWKPGDFEVIKGP